MEWFKDTINYTVDPWNELDPELVRENNTRAIYQKFIFDTYTELRGNELTDIPEVSDKFAIIIEPRPHMILEYVLRNVMYFLGDGWGLQIFVGNKNEEYVRNITKDWSFVHIENLDVDNLSLEEYNDLRKSPGFWGRVKGETILCFEMDTLLCRQGVEAYIEYDYIGAPWPKRIQLNPNVRIGNGGLSIRNKRAMIEICNTCKRSVIPNDDVFFSMNLQLRDNEFKLPTVEIAKQFSCETIFHPEPFGIHKPWRYMSEDQMKTILSSIDYGASVE